MENIEYKIKAVSEYHQMLAECDEVITNLYDALKIKCEDRMEIITHLSSLVDDILSDLPIGKDSNTIYTKAFLNQIPNLVVAPCHIHGMGQAYDEGEQIFKTLVKAGLLQNPYTTHLREVEI